MTEADVWSSLTRAVGAAVAATAPSEDPRRLTTLLDRIGWAPDLVPIDAVREALTALATLPTDPPDDLDEIARLLATVGAAIDLLRAAGHGLPGDAATELGRDLVEALTIAGIRDRVPVAWAVLVLLGLAVNGDPADPVPELRDADGRLLRRAMARPRLRLDRLPDLLTDPVASLRERYRPDGFADAAATAAAADRLLPPVRDLVHALGGIAVFGFTPDELYDLGEDGNRAAASMLTFMLPTGPEDLDGPDLPDSVGAGASVALEPADGAGPGVVIVPHGAVSATGAVGRWEFSASVSGEAEGLLVRVDGVVGAPGSPPRLVADLRAALKPGADEPAFRLGPATGTRLDVGGLDVRALFDRRRQRGPRRGPAQAGPPTCRDH